MARNPAPLRRRSHPRQRAEAGDDAGRLPLAVFLDGINYSYTPDDYTPMKTLYISIFNGKDWDISDKPVTE